MTAGGRICCVTVGIAVTGGCRTCTPNRLHTRRDLLGAKLVAYLGKVKETRAVRQWADGEREIANTADLERLRPAYRAAWLINQRNSTQVVQAWFQGLNPFLDDGTPARLLRNGDIETDGAQVIAAARQFAAVG
jgi:hypothetical protein